MRESKFASRVFFWCGVYGLIVLLPGYFLEKRIGIDLPPAITHPEYYYGFLGTAVAFQIVFFIIASDPVRYRMMMLAGMVEKFSFALAAIVLFAGERMPSPPFAFAMIDLLLGILFVIAYSRSRPKKT